MPKIMYTDKQFHSKTLKIIVQADLIIEEYQADGMDLTLRQLYYQFVARGIIPNSDAEYHKLGTIIGDARLAGLIDWTAIEDRTRNLKKNSHWDNPGQIIRSAAYGFQVDHWQGQKYRPEVWIEKEALIGVISRVCEELDVGHYACKGYVSLSEMWRSARRFSDMEQEGQTPVIIHLGDHDPSGMDMTRDISDRQYILSDFSGVEVKRIALNIDQVHQFNPPPNTAKLSDSRAKDYIRDYGYESWELDALEPRMLRDLIQETVLTYRDDELYNEVMEKEKEYKKTLNRIEENWETL